MVTTLDEVFREEWGRVVGTLTGVLGDTDEARDAYRRARELTDDGAERRFLERRLTARAGLDGDTAAPG